MAQPQSGQQPSRGRSGTPNRVSRLGSQSSGWGPQLGSLGSTTGGPTATSSSAAQPRGPSILPPGWEQENGPFTATIDAAASAAAAAAAAATGPAVVGGTLPHTSSLGVLTSTVGPAAAGPSGLPLGPDRKLVPTRSSTTRALAVQPPRSMSHPRSAGRGSSAAAGWAPAGGPSGTATHGAASPRSNLGTGSAGAGSAAGGGGVAGGPGAAGATTGSGDGLVPQVSSLGTAVGQVGGAGAVQGQSAGAAGPGGSRLQRTGSGLRPHSTRRSGNSPAGGPGAAAAAAAAVAALSVGVVEPYGAAAGGGGGGPPLGPAWPRTSLDLAAQASQGSLNGIGGGLGVVQGIAYTRTGSDGRGVSLRPNSASPLGPNGGAGGACPPLPLPLSSTSAGSKPGSSRRPLSAQQDVVDGAAQALSRVSLTCISDVPASPSLVDVSMLAPGPSLPSLAGVAGPPAAAAAAAAAQQAGAASCPKRTGSSLLVSLDGLPPGPSRLYEAITKQLEESDVELAEEVYSGSEDGEGAGCGAGGGGGGAVSVGDADSLPATRPPAGQHRLAAPPHPSHLRSSPGELQQTRQGPAAPPAHQPPSSTGQLLPQQQQQRQQQQGAMAARGGQWQQSETNLQLGQLRAASFQEAPCTQPPQPVAFPPPASSYSPLQPNIRGRLSWTGTGTTAGAAGAAGPASPAAQPLPPSNRAPSPPALLTPSSSSVSVPSAPPPTPAAVAYRFPALAFPPNAPLPPHVAALLQQPLAAASSSGPRDQATMAAAAVLAAAAGAVASAAAVADLRNWFCPPSARMDDAPGSPGAAAGVGTAAASSAPSQRLPGGSVNAAAAAAAAIAGRPYVINKLRLNLGVVGPSTAVPAASRRPSDTDYYGGTAPSHPLPSSPIAAAAASPHEHHAGGAIVPGAAATGLLPPATGQRGGGGGGGNATSLPQQLQQHLSYNHQLLAQLQQQRAAQHAQHQQTLAAQHAQHQQALLQQQLQLQQQQQQRRQQHLAQLQQLPLAQLQQLQQMQQQKQPLGKLVSLAEALAAAAEEELEGYFISASAVGPPLDWEGGGDAPGSPRRQLLAAWRGGGGGADAGTADGGFALNRPPTATRTERSLPPAPSRPRAGGGGGGGGGALRQQAWLEGSAQLMTACMQLNKPQLWVQNGPRPVSEAVLWLARLTDSAPTCWESDGWHRRPCSRSYLEGLRSGSGAVEADVEAEERAAARAAAEQQQRAAAAREGTTAAALGIAGRVQTWRPAPRPSRVRSAGPRRRRVTSSDSSEEDDDDEEEEEEESSDDGDEPTARGKSVAAARGQRKPRPPPAPRPRPAAPKPRLPVLQRGRGRVGAGSDVGVFVDDEELE